jgi:hypothetical protein
MATTYEKIASTTLGSAASSITFSSIAATYTDLRLVFTTISGAAAVFMRLNSDTGNNYSSTYLLGSGTAASSGRYSNNGAIPLADNTSSTGWSFQAADIFSYAGATYKTVLSENNNDQNGSGWLERTVSLWRNTAAINTILITTLGTDTFSAGSTATLYGILKA